MNKELAQVLVAGILHDIGKPAQRAERPRSDNMIGIYLPTNKGKSTHWHSIYTNYFIENDLPLPSELEKQRSKIAHLASCHHKPASGVLEEQCLMIADCLSSGHDRVKTDDSESQNFRESRLISIFDEVELSEHKYKDGGQYHYKLSPLETQNRLIFPENNMPKGNAKEYFNFFNEFLKDAKKLPLSDGMDIYIESLASLLEKYLWCVTSSSYETVSDVSLYDHSRSTACIAQALYLYHNIHGSTPRWEDNQDKFILLTADLSGIQNYIFGISKSTGKGVAKIFRARSFYLQALSKSVALSIQRKLGISSLANITEAGGKFTMLLPNIPDVTDKLDEIDLEIQNWFMKKFKGLLTLSLSFKVKLSQQDFHKENFQLKMDEASEALEQIKLMKLKKAIAIQGPIINEGYEDFEGGNCSICEINSADSESTRKYKNLEGVETSICKDCCQHIAVIGTKLPRSEFCIFSAEGDVELFGGISITLRKDNPSNFKALYIASLNENGIFARWRIARYIPELRAEELMEKCWFEVFSKDECFKLMADDIQKGGTFVPKTFGMIAAKSHKELIDSDGEKGIKGRPLLGFLKADVDNLGLAFSLGLKNKTMARIASLSRQLDFFFSDYLVSMLKEKYPDIYVVYSGGDDLFLIGPWNNTLDFASAMRKEFSRYTCNNKDFSISCGILLAKPRLPVRKAVEMSEILLNEAKKREKPKLKDAVALLDEVIGWDELDQIIKEGQIIDQAVSEKEKTGFSTAFLYRILEYRKMYKQFTGDNRVEMAASGRYLALASYDIARNILPKAQHSKDPLQIIYDWLAIPSSGKSLLHRAHLPVFYALNLNRDINN